MCELITLGVISSHIFYSKTPIGGKEYSLVTHFKPCIDTGEGMNSYMGEGRKAW